MANRSSTSNSKQARGAPWSLVTAIGILIVLELVLRFLNPRGLIAAPADRELSYRGVVPELEAYGAPEIAIVGSSRARRAVIPQMIRDVLREQGVRARVGNFALGGAMAEEIEANVRRLIEASPPPGLVVWPISPREFELRKERPTPQVRYLWRPSDWWLTRRAVGKQADGLLPDAIRNEAARYSLFVRYRFAFRDLVEQLPGKNLEKRLSHVFLGRRGPTTLHGDIDPKHLGPRGTKSLDVSARRINQEVTPEYSDPSWPNNYQAEHLEGAVQNLRKAGVPLLFVELPLSPVLLEALPETTNERFRAHLRGVARRHSVPFVTLEELSVTFEKPDFLEISHVNRLGAEKYTTALAPVVAREYRASR